MRLSPKEVKVLTLVAKGKTDKEVGVILELSERTVQAYMTRILQKLGAVNRVNAAVLFFVEHPELFKKKKQK